MTLDYLPINLENVLEFPSGPLPLDSNLYIPRPPVEELSYFEITRPGALVRVKASQKMGKNSLLLRILAYAESQAYQSVYIDMHKAETEVFSSLDRFLRWLCINVSWQLNLKPMLRDYWDEEIGSKISCSIYFQEYILQRIDTPLVLAINEMNLIFECPGIAHEFLPLLRSWHEEAKQSKLWKKLRLILLYSTEVYLPLAINQSPFNVGLPIKLLDFTQEQIIDLACRHGLDWEDRYYAKELMDMLGGHPYLIRLALYYLSLEYIEMKKLLNEAPTLTGIYSDYLRGHLETIQKYPSLTSAVKQMLINSGSVRLDAITAYQLESMGIAKLNGNEVNFSCELYNRYFASQLMF